MTQPTQRRLGTTVFLWGLQLLVAAEFLWAGARKLTGATGVDTFDAIGLGQWFRYFTGSIEVGGAVLLLLPGLAAFAALLLAATMVGASLTNLFITGNSAVVTLALLAVTTTIATMRWSDRHAPRAPARSWRRLSGHVQGSGQRRFYKRTHDDRGDGAGGDLDGKAH